MQMVISRARRSSAPRYRVPAGRRPYGDIWSDIGNDFTQAGADINQVVNAIGTDVNTLGKEVAQFFQYLQNYNVNDGNISPVSGKSYNYVIPYWSVIVNYLPNSLRLAVESALDFVLSGGKSSIKLPSFSAYYPGPVGVGGKRRGFGTISTLLTASQAQVAADKAAGGVLTSSNQNAAPTGWAPADSVIDGVANFFNFIGTDIIQALGKAFQSGNVQAILTMASKLFGMAGSILQGQWANLNPFDPNGGFVKWAQATDNNSAWSFDFLCALGGGLLAMFLAFAAPALIPLLPELVLHSVTGHPNAFSTLVRGSLSLVGGSSTGVQRIQGAMQIGQSLAMAILGVPISPSTAVNIAILAIENIPLVPIATIISMVLADPVAEKQIASLFGPAAGLVNHILPVTMTCMTASNPAQWISCAGGIVEETFPGIISRMQKWGVSLATIRQIAGAVFETDGDPTLFLDEARYPGIGEALVGVGVVGLAAVAMAIPGLNPQVFVENTLGPALKSGQPNLFTRLIQGIDLMEHFVVVLPQYDGKGVGVQSFPGSTGFSGFGDDTDVTSVAYTAMDSAGSLLATAVGTLASVGWDVRTGLIKLHAGGLFYGMAGQGGGLTAEAKAMIAAIKAAFPDTVFQQIFKDVFTLAGLGTPASPATTTSPGTTSSSTKAPTITAVPALGTKAGQRIGSVPTSPTTAAIAKQMSTSTGPSSGAVFFGVMLAGIAGIALLRKGSKT